MKSPITTASALALAGIGFSTAQAQAQAQKKPNVLFIMTDQQSYNMVSALNRTPYFSTPNIDRLVRSGYTFANCAAAHPVSVPSRFALLTGESPAEYGIRINASPASHEKEIMGLITQRAMGVLFKKAGYETYYGGKVHLPFANGKSGKESLTSPPTEYGFDHVYTLDEREILARKSAAFFSEYKSDKPFLLFVSFINPHDICRVLNYCLSNKKATDYPGVESIETLDPLRDVMRSKGDAYYQTDRGVDLPFNYAATDRHPLNPTRYQSKYSDTDWRKYRWTYERLVELVDAEIGKVLNGLDKSKYRDNTIVIFTSDHGDMSGAHHMSGKNIFYEECLKIPFIFKGPGIRKGVIDTSSPVCNGWDALPTMLDLAGIPVPPELKGISLRETLTKGTPVAQKRKYIHSETDNGFCIIEDGRYQYSRHEWTPKFGLDGDPEVLFDLQKDPGQLHNLTGDTDYAAKLVELRTALDHQMSIRGLSFKKGPTAAQLKAAGEQAANKKGGRHREKLEEDE
ncbi:sulfatase [Bacteroidia bacterium]|nr:sulfatase [Bacteroidia bacterium]